MFQETPIYARLVTERGDVPGQVRRDAERIHQDLARVITAGPPSVPGPARRA
ncbi:hypothetical protein ACH4F6_21030 [Streptomyces sp. NPDC017936]|uniref:hypothetical protein n=1 Tax=Streptomyces sp. NPDC017936 TaxID=3365016 RepID=UPI003791FF27